MTGEDQELERTTPPGVGEAVDAEGLEPAVNGAGTGEDGASGGADPDGGAAEPGAGETARVAVSDEEADEPPPVSGQSGNGQKEGEPSSLEAELAAARDEAEEQRNAFLRMAAELQNFRKRAQRDQQQARQFAIEGFAKDLLPVADNLDRALAAIQEGGGNEVKALEEGVRMIQQELMRTFDRHGITRIDALNTPFDPNLHQAVLHVAAPDGRPGDVVQEMQSGYLLNGRLLRPTMVGVAKGDG